MRRRPDTSDGDDHRRHHCRLVHIPYLQDPARLFAATRSTSAIVALNNEKKNADDCVSRVFCQFDRVQEECTGDVSFRN